MCVKLNNGNAGYPIHTLFFNLKSAYILLPFLETQSLGFSFFWTLENTILQRVAYMQTPHVKLISMASIFDTFNLCKQVNAVLLWGKSMQLNSYCLPKKFLIIVQYLLFPFKIRFHQKCFINPWLWWLLNHSLHSSILSKSTWSKIY